MFLSLTFSACFLTYSKDYLIRGGTTQNELGRPLPNTHQSLIMKMSTEASLQPDLMEAFFSIEDPFYQMTPTCVKLTRV